MDTGRQELLQPPRQDAPLAWPSAVPLALLALVLLPAWADGGATYLSDVLGQMVSPLLLPALGMVFVLQRRRLDLGVWAMYALGSAVAARLLPDQPTLAVLAVLGLGLGVGLLNAFLVALCRLPCWPVTLLVATLGVSGFAYFTGGQEIALNRSATLLEWATVSQPAALTGIAFIAALLVGLLASGERAQRQGDRWALAGALLMSSVLSAWGGLCWFVQLGVTPTRANVLGDLRVLAAAVLCGAFVLRGLGRALLAAVLLPSALLVATIWQQTVWDFGWARWHGELLVLAAMALGVQWVLYATVGAVRSGAASSAGGGRGGRGGRALLVIASLLMLLGLAVVALAAYPWPYPVLRYIRWGGLGLWLLGGLAASGKIVGDFRRARESF